MHVLDDACVLIEHQLSEFNWSYFMSGDISSNSSSSTKETLYFLGIGGSAMGALACACAEEGHLVLGSDAGVYSPMREQLEARGIVYHNSFDASHISGLDHATIVVGNAVSRGNVELEAILDQRLNIQSMPEVLRRLFLKKHCSIVVSGTHGKTTTSSLCSWVLSNALVPTGFFIGAVTGNFGIGCRAVPQHSELGMFVSEGDEYDTAYFDKRSKFLSYRPDIAVINNIEFDHADIFSSIDDIKKSFRLFARLVPASGLIVALDDGLHVADVVSTALSPIETFGFGSTAHWRAVDVDYSETATHFTVLRKGLIYARFELRIVGEHNLLNALAVIAVAHRVGLTVQQIQDGFHTFVSPKRRLEVIGSFHDAVVIDDFGHHPTAIRLTIGGARQKYPTKRIIACFEPRSNTSTRSFFQEEFVHAFEEADEVILGCVHRPERYAETDRLDRDQLALTLRAHHKTVFVCNQTLSTQADWGREIRDYLSTQQLSDAVILLLSNGDFGSLRSILCEDAG